MYQNKFVCAIKVGGRILREVNGTVQIPFGSEYSVYLKNMNSVRAKVKLEIDGNKATDTWLVIPGNTSLDLERFLNGNNQQGRRFKFIERTAQIESHRGIGGEDGLVRVEFQVETVQPVVTVPRYESYPVPVPYYVPRPWPVPPHTPWIEWRYSGTTTNADPGDLEYSIGTYTSSVSPATEGSAAPPTGGGGTTSSSIPRAGGQHTNSGTHKISRRARAVGSSAAGPARQGRAPFASYDEVMPMAMPMAGAAAPAAEVGEAGITVQGSMSNQRFITVPDFKSGPSEVMVLQLRGIVGNAVVTRAVTVKTKVTCGTCGTKSKSGIEFCGGCGAALSA